MNTKEVLIKARELISDPNNWTAHAYARDAKGERVEINSPAACKFCALGAVQRVIGRPHDPSLSRKAWNALHEQTSDYSVASVNDNEGHAAVMEMFDKAIAECP